MPCNKIEFESKAEGKRFLKDKAVRNNCRGTLTVYKCLYCEGYHLTSMSKSERRISSRKYKSKMELKI